MNAEIIISFFVVLMMVFLIGFGLFLKQIMDENFGGIKDSLKAINEMAEVVKKKTITLLVTMPRLSIKYEPSLRY